jgi:transcription elongation factor GreA-like protein
MLHNVTLANRSQQYHVVTRQWISEINFFTIETTFLQNLLMNCISIRADNTFAEKRKMTVERLLKLDADKSYSDLILNEQCNMLEQITQESTPENEVDLACKQMELEYLMPSLNEEYREVKKELFSLVESVLPDNRQ